MQDSLRPSIYFSQEDTTNTDTNTIVFFVCLFVANSSWYGIRIGYIYASFVFVCVLFKIYLLLLRFLHRGLFVASGTAPI